MSFLLYIIFYSISLVAIFLIASLVIIRQRVPVYRNFAIFSFCVGLWLALQFLAQLLHNHHTAAIFMLRSAVIVSTFMALAFLSFAYSYAERKIHIWRYIILPLIFLGLGFTRQNVAVADIVKDGIAIRQAGIVYIFVLVFVAFAFGRGIFAILADKAAHHDKGRKIRNRLLIFAVSQAVIINLVFGTSSSGNLSTQFLVPITCLIMTVLVAYTIIRHGLFDIRLIVARSLGYILSLGFVTGVFSLLVFGSGTLIESHYSKAVQQLFSVTVTIVLVLTYPPLKRFFDRITNKYFYRDAYDPQVLFNELNTLLVSSIDMDKILNGSADIIRKYIKAEHVIFHINETKNTNFKTLYSGNLKPSTEDVDLAGIIHGAGEGPSALIVDELPEDQNKLKEKLADRHIAIAVNLFSSSNPNKRIGYMALGSKSSGNPYSKQDVQIIRSVANELVVAVQNALSYEEIKGFNVTLQEKVDKATYQLRKANQRLKQLDETKDDFISMASHQLRTPLTSVKGNLSMVLDGDVGKVAKSQKGLLSQAFTSSQRMVDLIADLLNVSRLKTGKFVIDAQPTNLDLMIKEEISQLKETAKGHNLELTYDAPEHFPALMLDATKTRQVIMNFIDNAIYYTPSGGHIAVQLMDKPTTVELTVSDDGIGVPKAEQHHLFSKFYRAGNAKKARPDGTGLGLFMAKKVIVAEGGALIFNSQEGKGSTFGFTFPKASLQAKPTKR